MESARYGIWPADRDWQWPVARCCQWAIGEAIAIGTARLDTAAMADLLARIDAWAADQDGLALPRGGDYQQAIDG